MLDLKALLAKILNTLSTVDGNCITIANTIGICWGTATIGSNSAVTAYLPITYSTTSGMVCLANCVYWSNGTYVAPTISVQKYNNRINLYGRVSTSTIQSGYLVDWLTIGLI